MMDDVDEGSQAQGTAAKDPRTSTKIHDIPSHAEEGQTEPGANVVTTSKLSNIREEID